MDKNTNELRRIFSARLDAATCTDTYAQVAAVDTKKLTADVTIGNITRRGVLLYAIEGAPLEGMVCIPKIGSTVIVSTLGRGRYYVSLFSALETILLGGTDNRGAVKIAELEENLQSLKYFAEAMHRAIPSAINAVGAAMQANGATGMAAYDTAMTGRKIELKAMENEKVKH